jgi:hypothetical protein
MERSAKRINSHNAVSRIETQRRIGTGILRKSGNIKFHYVHRTMNFAEVEEYSVKKLLANM